MRRRQVQIAIVSLFAVPSSLPAMTLNEAIAAASAHAPEISEADAESEAAAGRVEQAKAGARPTAVLSGSVGFGRLDPGGFFGLNAATVTPRAVQLVVEQPLYSGGRVRAGIDQARADVAAARSGTMAARTQIAVAVVQAYGDVLTTAKSVALYQQLISETEEIERQARLKFKAGESPNTEISQARARLAEAQAGLARAQGGQISALAHFRNLVGMEAERLDPIPANPEIPSTLEEAITIAIANNPALVQARANVVAAEAVVRNAKGERLPSVGAFLEGAVVRDEFFPDYRADSVTVGVRARWEFYSGGRVSGKVAETGAQYRAADARLRATRTKLEERVIDAFQNVRTTQLVEEASAAQSRAAEETRINVEHEVHVGMKPQLALLDAERDAIVAGAASSRAQTDRIVAAYALNLLLGKY